MNSGDCIRRRHAEIVVTVKLQVQTAAQSSKSGKTIASLQRTPEADSISNAYTVSTVLGGESGEVVQKLWLGAGSILRTDGNSFENVTGFVQQARKCVADPFRRFARVSAIGSPTLEMQCERTSIRIHQLSECLLRERGTIP